MAMRLLRLAPSFLHLPPPEPGSQRAIATMSPSRAHPGWPRSIPTRRQPAAPQPRRSNGEDRQVPLAGRPITAVTWHPFRGAGRSPQSQWAIRPCRPHCGRSILDHAEVALGIGKELSEMPEITLEDYQRVDRQLERQRARRGFAIHAIVYGVVLPGLSTRGVGGATGRPACGAKSGGPPPTALAGFALTPRPPPASSARRSG